MARYCIRIEHIRGAVHMCADALSRLPMTFCDEDVVLGFRNISYKIKISTVDRGEEEKEFRENIKQIA